MLQPGEIINNYPVESDQLSQIVIKVLFSELEKPRLKFIQNPWQEIHTCKANIL